MRKHNQIYALGAPHYEAHFRFLRKFKDFKCALWSEKYGKHFINLLTPQANFLVLGCRYSASKHKTVKS